MRLALSLVLLAAIGCEDNGGDPPKSVLETNATSYVATPLTGAGIHSHEVQLMATLRNTSNLIVRVYQCTPTTTYPVYGVSPSGDGQAAWDPNITCTFGAGVPYQDLGPGDEHTFSLQLRAPWFRTVLGEPIGAIEGSFFLLFETYICGLVSRNGLCSPADRIERVRSNTFSITQ